MATKHSKTPKIIIDYDARTDILYISFGKSRPGIARETDDRNLIRVDPYSDEVVGITILDFKEKYLPKTNNIEKYAKGLIPKILRDFKHTQH
jgi:uncharacterized protein YuzE